MNIIYINNKTMTILIHKFGNCKYEIHKMMITDHKTMINNMISEDDLNGRGYLMGRIEHITTQQIIGEWGSINNFASSHGVSPASTKMVIYVDGAKSKPVEEALKKYGYLNLLRFEKELRKRGQTFSEYLAEDGLNPVELIETIRMKEIHPEVLSGLKRRGYWGVLETVGGSEEVGDLSGKGSNKQN